MTIKGNTRSIRKTAGKPSRLVSCQKLLQTFLYAALALAFLPTAHASSKSFLDLRSAGITSSSLNPEQYKDWLELSTWGWAMSNSLTFSDFNEQSSGQKPTLQSVSFLKALDNNSAQLYQRVLNGLPISSVKLEAVSGQSELQPNGEVDYENRTVFTFENVIFTSASQAFAAGDDQTLEQLTFIFSNFCVQSSSRGNNGAEIPGEILCFDVRTNQIQN